MTSRFPSSATGDASQFDRQRGGWDTIYRRVGPGVVRINTDSHFGAGLLIDDQGQVRVLTNHHVIEKKPFLDTERKSSYVMIHLGELTESGAIERATPPLRGYFLDGDRRVDLALLELSGPIPDGPLRALSMATATPAPGHPCALISHARQRGDWTFRRGAISGLKKMPADFEGELANVTFLPRREVAAQVSQLVSHDVVLSDFAASAGDSGGPLLNKAGEVIGITKAVIGHTTIHVGLTEIEQFLKTASRSPDLFVPDAWTVDERVRITEHEQVLLMFPDPRSIDRPNNSMERRQYVLDVDGDSRKLVRQVKNEERKMSDLVGLEPSGVRKFDAEVIFHDGPDQEWVYYDTDNDDASTFDYVLVYKAPRKERVGKKTADVMYTLDADGDWRFELNVKKPYLDASPLRDPVLRKEFSAMVKKLGWTR